MPQPEPPIDIRIHLTNGQVMPADSRYIGRDQHGVNTWEIITRVDPNRLKKITVAEIPARTQIIFHSHPHPTEEPA